MLFQFITSPEFMKPSTANPDTQKTASNGLKMLQEQIRQVIDKMPSYDFCRQGALNLGLPLNIIDFKNTEARVESETNQKTLNFLLMQLRTLLR